MSIEIISNSSEEQWKIIHTFNSGSIDILPLEEAANVGPEYHVETRTLLLTIMICCSLVGNFLVFCTFYPYCKRGIPKSKVMFLHLAIADCFVAFFTLGAQLLWEQDKTKYFVDNISCKGMKFMQTYSLSLSGYMLVAIALDRYNAIIHALNRTRGIKWWVIFPWVFSIVPAIPCPFLFHISDDIGMCVSLFYSEKHRVDEEFLQFWRRLYITAVVVVVFVIPTVLLLFGYIGIYYKLSKQSEVFTPAEQTSSSLPRAKRKTLTLAMVITSVFLLTSIPYIVQEFYLAFGNSNAIDANAYLVALSGVISAFNSVLNPYIYLLFQSTDSCIRQSFRSLIALIQSRRWSVHRKNTSVISVSSKTSRVDMNTIDHNYMPPKAIETALICSINAYKEDETCV